MRFGPYEVTGTAAAGSTATVYRCRDDAGRTVAVKALVGDGSEVLVGRLRAEAALLRSLDDPHVVGLVDLALDDDPPWIAEDWVDGASLDRLLQVHGSLTAEQGVGVLLGAVAGLAHGHSRGVVHRDVAPGNVLVDESGTSMLVDFGMAAPVGAAGACGTPAFMSPEAAAGGAALPQSDVYSAGAVLFLLLSGRPPFAGRDVEDVLRAHREQPAPALAGHGRGLAGLVRRCLHKDPAERPPDGAALLAELREQADRRFGAGWLARAAVTTLVPAARTQTGAASSVPAVADAASVTGGSVDTGSLPTSDAPPVEVADGQPPQASRPSPARRTRRTRAVAVVAAAVVVAAVVGTTAVLALTGGEDRQPVGPSASPVADPAAAAACTEPAGDAPFTMTPPCGPVGSTVAVTGAACADTGASPDGRFAFYNNVDGNFSGAQQTDVEVASDGTFSFAFVVPTTGTTRDGATLDPLPPGEYAVEISCDTTEDLRSTFTVVDSSPVASPPPGGQRYASYEGELTTAYAESGRTEVTDYVIGIRCQQTCVFEGFYFWDLDAPLTPLGGGRFSFDLPAEADPCAGTPDGAPPGNSATGTVQLTGDTMTFEIVTPTVDVTCEGGTGGLYEEGRTLTYRGTLTDGEPPYDG